MPWRQDFSMYYGLDAMVHFVIVNFAVDLMLNDLVPMRFKNFVCNS